MSPRDDSNDTRELARKNQVGAVGLTVQTAADVRRVLGDQIAQLTANPDLDPARKAGLLAQLAPIALRAIEDATLETRIAAIEGVLRGRTDHPISDETQALIAAIQTANPPRSDGTQATNARTLAAHYSQFTAEERVRLALAAQARDDEEEITRLVDSRPQRTLFVPDPAFRDLFYKCWVAILHILLKWVEVSNLVVRKELLAGLSNMLACQAEEALRIENGSRRLRKAQKAVYADHCASRDVLQEDWRWATAAWKGIDSAITRFCGEAGFARDQLFSVYRPLPDVIEDAREVLAPDVQADSEWKESIYRQLCDPWPSLASKQQTDCEASAASGPPTDQAGGAKRTENCKTISWWHEGGVIYSKVGQPAA
jgi:hypothetical protein